MKKLLSVFCVLALLFVCASCNITESIDDPNDPANIKVANILNKQYTSTLTDGGFTFKVLDDGSLVVSGFSGSGETLTIPEKVDGKSVVGVEQGLYGSKAYVT